MTHFLARLARSHRHVTGPNAAAFGLASVALVLVVVGGSQLRPTVAPNTAPTIPPSLSVATTRHPPAHVAAGLPPLPRLPRLIQAAVLVTSRAPLSRGTVNRAMSLAGATASLPVAVGDVDLGRGRTRALAADPASLRVWTPGVTAHATGVWQRAVIGEAVVAHAVAKADGVPLGGPLVVRRATTIVQLRVGAFATTQLPGIGLVVNLGVGRRLGLSANTGLLLAVPGGDPLVVAAELQHSLGTSTQVESVLSNALPEAGWAPPALGPITSGFGMRVHPITHAPQFHEGIDIGAPLGSPVYAMTSGEVLYAGPASGFGNEIVLSHPGGVSSVYGHVSEVFVSSGSVKTGQVIALVGNEGESTGPHLHVEIHVQDQPVDPVSWLKAHGVGFTR